MTVVYLSWTHVESDGFAETPSRLLLGGFALRMHEEVLVPNVFSWPMEAQYGSEFALISIAEPQTIEFQHIRVRVVVFVASDEEITGPARSTEALCAFANSSAGLDLIYETPLRALDSVAYALAVYLSIDKATWLVTRLAAEQAKQMPSAHTRLAAWLRGLYRAYLRVELAEAFVPILIEICSVNLNTKTLADQTSFASLAVRVLTAAVELVNANPIFITPLADQLRPVGPMGEYGIRMPSISGDNSARMPSMGETYAPARMPSMGEANLRTPSVGESTLDAFRMSLGTMMCACLVSCAFCFLTKDIPESDLAGQQLLRVYRVVMQAIEGCEDDSSSDGTLIRGLSADLRNKAPFANLGQRELVLTSGDFSPEAATVLGAYMPSEEPPRKSLAEVMDNFQKAAFARESTPNHQLHYFHQYHLHDHSNVHHNRSL